MLPKATAKREPTPFAEAGVGLLIYTNMCERYSSRCVDGLVDLILRIRVVFVRVVVLELDVLE